MKNKNVNVQNSNLLKAMSIILMMTLLFYQFGLLPTKALIKDDAITEFVDFDTLNNQVSDNRIIVMFDNQTSLRFPEHSVSTFSQLGVKSVKNISKPLTEIALKNKQKSELNTAKEKQDNVFDLSAYNEVLCLELNEGGMDNLVTTMNEIRKMDGVLYVGFDYKCQSASAGTSATNDTLISEQWALSNIQLPQAWEINKVASNVVVAVIDSGIDSTHPDLEGRILTGYCRDFTKDSITGNDDDTSAILPNDDDGHGTMVAGIIAANSNNATGIAGVCGEIQIVSLKVTLNSVGYLSDTLEAIAYATSIGADIINYSNSFAIGTGINFTFPEQYYEEGIDDSNAMFSSVISSFPGLFVCSAGNNAEYLDTTTDNIKPAQFMLDNMITVVASEMNGLIWSLSNRGELTTDIYAPGYSIISCFPSSQCNVQTCGESGSEHIAVGYHKDSGTSFATPYVTGVAALLLSLSPDLSKAKIKSLILDNVDFNSTYECVSGGKLNAYKALDGLTNHTDHVTYIEALPQNYLGQKHQILCYSCDLHYYEDHALYVYSAENDSSVIKCVDCNYTIECNGEPEYGYGGTNGHYVSCSCGCYSFFESHNATYTQLPNLFTHNAYCSECGTNYSDAHTWVQTSSGYRCTKCLKTATIIPDIMSIIPEDELAALLAGLTDEELAELTLALNEDERARIAALLPEREEDYVSE